MTTIIILLTLLALLQVGDIWTTYKVISQGGREKNPVVQKLIKWMGLLPGLIIPKAVAIGVCILVTYLVKILCLDLNPAYSYPESLAGLWTTVLLVLCVVYARIVRKNYKLIK